MPAHRETRRPWAVVVPVKRLETAKTRLAPLPPEQRRALALAMALDVVEAAARCAAVALVVAVTDDEDAARRLEGSGARVVADLPDAGLNPALEYGAAEARSVLPDTAVAALAADLPALSETDLGTALAGAVARRRCVVADADGTGTTALLAGPGVALAPEFGPGSLDRHLRSGAVLLDLPADCGLRRDVDTLDDLRAAACIGLGRHTAATQAVRCA